MCLEKVIKCDKMLSKPRIISLFPISFNKWNNTNYSFLVYYLGPGLYKFFIRKNMSHNYGFIIGTADYSYTSEYLLTYI